MTIVILENRVIYNHLGDSLGIAWPNESRPEKQEVSRHVIEKQRLFVEVTAGRSHPHFRR